MDDDQQFCLRWNNHQSTLIAVFDTLLEKGVHVDCTLAAEGQTLKAHKVVLSACSPYFENVLSQQYDKHPIIILKDVKFAELKAMMDYMYRGEVNISQDQLAALLKAAESLQIKGLSDSKPPPPRASSPLIRGRIVDSAVSGQIHSREGSSSPLPRKRKKVRRSSLNDTDAEVLNNSDHIPSLNHMPSSVPVTPRPPAVEPSVENDIVAANKVLPAEANDIAVKVKSDISARDDIEPKGELICEDGTEDSVEDLTLDEEIDSETEHSGPGPSHPQGDCVQSFAWHMDRAQDESTPSMDGQRDSQVAKKYDVALAGILKRTMPLTRGSLRADKNEKYALKSITRKPRILLRPKAAAKQQEVIPSKGAVNSKTPNILVEILPTVSVVAKTTEILIEDAEITESLVKEPVTFGQTDIGKSCGKCSCALAKDSSTYTSDRNVDNSPSPEIAIKDSVITALKVEKSRKQAATKGRNIASTKVGKTESETKGSSPNFETLTRGRNSMLNKRLEKSPTAESPAADAKVTSLLIANFIKTESPNLPCAQYATDNGYKCPNCKRTYNARKNLVRHVNLECGREPQHKCAHCSHRTHRRNELKRHIQKKHTNVDSKSD